MTNLMEVSHCQNIDSITSNDLGFSYRLIVIFTSQWITAGTDWIAAVGAALARSHLFWRTTTSWIISETPEDGIPKCPRRMVEHGPPQWPRLLHFLTNKSKSGRMNRQRRGRQTHPIRERSRSYSRSHQDRWMIQHRGWVHREIVVDEVEQRERQIRGLQEDTNRTEAAVALRLEDAGMIVRFMWMKWIDGGSNISIISCYFFLKNEKQQAFG
ncbi:unnamed protein product [Caenorhabditis nigoni]